MRERNLKSLSGGQPRSGRTLASRAGFGAAGIGLLLGGGGMTITEPEAVTRRDLGEAPEAGIGRAAVIGAILGYLVVFPLVSVILLVGGAGLVSAVAVGAYVAIWAGPGFGAMFGASYYVSQFADDKPSPSPLGAAAQTAAVALPSSPPRTQLVTVGDQTA